MLNMDDDDDDELLRFDEMVVQQIDEIDEIEYLILYLEHL
jgi:hypothetical protein